MADACQCTDEQWRDVVGWEGLYRVSSCGRVWSCPRVSTTKDGVRKRLQGRLRVVTSDGRYYSVSLSWGDSRPALTKRVHILVAEAFLGPRPSSRHEVCHDDGDGLNNHLSNLRWDTKASNNRDKLRHGTNYEANKVVCPRGHRLVTPNLVEAVLEARGARTCLACALALREVRSTLDTEGRLTHPLFILRAAEHYARIMSTEAAVVA